LKQQRRPGKGSAENGVHFVSVLNVAASAAESNLEPLREPQSLNDFAARIETEHEATVTAFKHGAEHAMAAGDLLIEAKTLKKRGGQWLPWLADHCSMSERTAQLYMRLSRNRPEIQANTQRVADMSLRGAVELLAPPDAQVEPDLPPQMLAGESAGQPMLEQNGPALGVQSATDADRDQQKPATEPHTAVELQPATGTADGDILEAAAEQKTAAEVATQPIERQPEVDVDPDLQEPAAESKSVVSAKGAPAVTDTGLSDFINHVLRLLQMTKSAKPSRYRSTDIEADGLAKLGAFVLGIANLKSKSEHAANETEPGALAGPGAA
jgi:hypothetical protein